MSSAARLVALNESEPFAAAVASAAGITMLPIEEQRFEGGEFSLRPLESVRGRQLFVLQSLAGTCDTPTAERLLRLLFLLNGLRDAGAINRVALLPYLAFARQERRTQPRDAVNTRYVAQLLEASGAAGVIALDVHDSAALDNSFRIPVDHLSALPMMVDHFATRFAQAKLCVASPDLGGIKRAQIFRELLAMRLGAEVTLAFIEKRRVHATLSVGALIGDTADRVVILIDDLCATGSTLSRAVVACRHAGASAVHVAVTHTPLPAGLEVLMQAEGLSGVTTTDSAGIHRQPSPTSPELQKLTVLSVAPLFGQAVGRLLTGQPLAPLLTQWPVPAAAIRPAQ
jgi:ribose-phosphate pyrophosphokinase